MQRSLKCGSKRKFRPVSLLVTLILTLYVLILIIPYVYALLASLSDFGAYYESIFPYPKNGVLFSNYVDAWENLRANNMGIAEMILNSLWFAGGAAVLGVLISSFGAYICAKYKFPGRKFLFSFALITMMIPIVGSMPSQLKFIDALGGYDSPLFVIINVQTIGATFVIMYSCFQSVDWGYAEAAFIDGAGHFRVFFQIMLPQVISPMIALIMSDFIMGWANVENPLIFYPNMPTLAVGLYHFRSIVITASGMRQYPAYFAALLMCILPTLLIFAIFQRRLMDIQIQGGLKG